MKTIKTSALAAILVLQGCSSLPSKDFVPVNPETLSEWSVEGAVAIKDKQGKQETFFEYKNINGEYEIAIKPESPVAPVQAVVKGREGEPESIQVEAKTSEGKALADTLQKTLPLDNMTYWLRALPATDDAKLEQDDNLLEALQEDGWNIEYDDYMQVSRYYLPEKIDMKKADTKVEIELVRAETGYLSSPCATGYMPDAEKLNAPDVADADVVRTLVPPSGEAPLPRWIDDQDFCKQLIKLHGKMPDPRIGLYGPGSMMWKLSAPVTPAG